MDHFYRNPAKDYGYLFPFTSENLYLLNEPPDVDNFYIFASLIKNTSKEMFLIKYLRILRLLGAILAFK